MALSTASIGRIGHFARPAQTRAPRSLGPARAAAGHVVDFGRSAVEEETIESAWPPAWWTDGPAFARIMAQEEVSLSSRHHLPARPDFRRTRLYFAYSTNKSENKQLFVCDFVDKFSLYVKSRREIATYVFAGLLIFKPNFPPGF